MIDAADEGASRGGLVAALEAESGIVCFVGAGGKKTAMRRLAEAHDGRVALTSTTKIQPFASVAAAGWIARDEASLAAAVLAAAARDRVVAYCGPPAGARRNGGVAPATVERLHREGGFDLTCVKADGARMRLVTVQGPDGPPLVSRPATIVGLCSVRAVGRPLDERVAHHPERVAAVSGAGLGEAIAPRHLARLVAHQHAALCGRGAAVVPVINMADDTALTGTAREVARLAFEESRALRKIVVACLIAEPPRLAPIVR